MRQISQITTNKVSIHQRTRVAAYCRVSTNSADQLHSYDRQVSYYTDYIKSKTEWQLVEIFADEGITGTRSEKRTEFQRMIKLCKMGEIDLIITKAVSRFARNVKETLEIVRELKKYGVAVRFEKEGIDTLNIGDEMLLNTFSAIAQEESISISQNVRMGNRNRMAVGEFIVSNAAYGFRYVNQKLEIYEPEAKIVKDIFNMYLSGKSTHTIAEMLNRRGVPTKTGGRWERCGIKYILRNEKYIGDCLYQKTYHTSTFPFRQKVNYGEEDQYYVTGSHTGFIPRDVFDKVGEIMAQRGTLTREDLPTEKYIFSKIMHCSECGAIFMRRKRKDHINWVCANHQKDKDWCPTHYLEEDDIKTAFVTMINKLCFASEDVLKLAVKTLEKAMAMQRRGNQESYDCSKEISELNEKLLMISKLKDKGYLDTVTFQRQSREIMQRITALKEKRLATFSTVLSDSHADVLKLQIELKEVKEPLSDFSDELFKNIVRKVEIDQNDMATFVLLGGLKFTEKCRWKTC